MEGNDYLEYSYGIPDKKDGMLGDKTGSEQHWALSFRGERQRRRVWRGKDLNISQKTKRVERRLSSNVSTMVSTGLKSMSVRRLRMLLGVSPAYLPDLP